MFPCDLFQAILLLVFILDLLVLVTYLRNYIITSSISLWLASSLFTVLVAIMAVGMMYVSIYYEFSGIFSIIFVRKESVQLPRKILRTLILNFPTRIYSSGSLPFQWLGPLPTSTSSRSALRLSGSRSG
jgi:hypothetical protein